MRCFCLTILLCLGSLPVSAASLVSATPDIQSSTPSTGATVTMTDPPLAVESFAAIKPAGTLATLTVTLPTCNTAADGKKARFGSTQIITALTVNAAAGTLIGVPTTLTVGGGAGFICRGADTTWYRQY